MTCHFQCSGIPLAWKDLLSALQSFGIYLWFLFRYLSPLCLVDDVNANPNKRQRQPALLGDHPPEYGKVFTLPEEQETSLKQMFM